MAQSLEGDSSSLSLSASVDEFSDVNYISTDVEESSSQQIPQLRPDPPLKLVKSSIVIRESESFEDFLIQFPLARLDHDMSKLGMAHVYDLVKANAKRIVEAERNGEDWPSYRTLERRVERGCPDVKMFVRFLNRQDSSIKECIDVSEFPRKDFEDKATWKLLLTTAYVKLSDVLETHVAMHPGDDVPTGLDLSVDGVPETTKSRNLFTVVSIRFRGKCTNIYPLRIAVTVGDKVNVEELLSPVFAEIKSKNLEVDNVLADAPMRAKLRNAVSHSGYYVSLVIDSIIIGVMFVKNSLELFHL